MRFCRLARARLDLEQKINRTGTKKLYDMERKLEKIFHFLVAYTSSAHLYIFFLLDLDIPRERRDAVAVLPARKWHMLG